MQISIDNYQEHQETNPYAVINSPHSLKAMSTLGLSMHDLIIPRAEDVRSFVQEIDAEDTEGTMKKYLRKYKEKIEERRSEVKALRDKLKLETMRQSLDGEQERLQKYKEELDRYEEEYPAHKQSIRGRSSEPQASPKDGKKDILKSMEQERARRLEELKKEREYYARPGSKNLLEENSKRNITSGLSKDVQGRVKSKYRQSDKQNLDVGEEIMEGQARDIEGMVDFEVKMIQMKEVRESHFEEKIDKRRKELEDKLAKYEHVMTEKERKQLIHNYERRLDRDIKQFEVEMNRRAVEHERKLKADKIMLENEKRAKLKADKDEFRKQREVVKNQLVRDLAKLRDGAITTGQLQIKYAHYMNVEDSMDSFMVDRNHPVFKRDPSGSKIN